MDPRLEEASLTGNLILLHQLLQEDRLLLSRPTTTLHATDNPLHIAASLGHAEVAIEIINRNSELARDLDGHGLTPLHLATANGHLPFVRELLKRAGSGLCLLRDKDGLMPIHTAAVKGRIHVLVQLMDACSESTRAVTYGGDSVLHLAVKSNCFEAAKFLVDKLVDGADDYELINLKDEKGNTALHLAVARKQFQTVKLLLSKQGIIDVNATNKKGFTPLDVLLESPSQHGDLVFGEAIRSAGGKTAVELETPPPPPPFHASHRDDLGIPHAERKPNKDDRRRDDEDYRNTPGTLMVVATLIATITFQAGLNPPGGFLQANGTNISRRDQVPPSGDKVDTSAGMAVLDDDLTYFLVFDVVGLFASLCIILLLICVVPGRKRMFMRVLVWVMWVAVFCTALAFQCAVVQIYSAKTVIGVLACAWIGLLRIAIISVSIRFIIHLLRCVRWLKRRGGDGEERIERGAPLLLKRILAVVSAAAVVAAAFYVNFKLESWIH